MPLPTLIKLDLEGYELPVLQSAAKTLTDRSDIDLIVEIMINDTDKDQIFSFLMGMGYNGYLITNAGLVREDRPLTLPYHSSRNKTQRTCWKNHFFSKRPPSDIEAFSHAAYGYYI